MELKTIRLSDEMQNRLETAMSSIKDEYNSTKDADLLLAAFSSALWENPLAGKKDFGLPPLTAAQRKESEELASALIGISDATGSPAIAIENLPKDPELYKLSLIGLNLSINTGEFISTNYDDNSKIKQDRTSDIPKTIIPLTFNGPIGLLQHGKEPLHSDWAGKSRSPLIRIIGSGSVGNNPLPTKVAAVSELIDEITNVISSDSNSKYKANRDEVIKALEAPVWKQVPISHNIDGNNTFPATKSAIYKNPNKNKEAPEYGLLRDPSKLSLDKNISPETLRSLNLNDELLNAVLNATLKSLDNLKQSAAGIVLEPGKALIFNDHLVVHGAGRFQNNSLPFNRCIYNLQAAAAVATEEKDIAIPGALSLVSSLQNTAPENIANPEKVRLTT